MNPVGKKENTEAKPQRILNPKVNIQRDVLNQEQTNINTGYMPPDEGLRIGLQKAYRDFSCLIFFIELVPILKWLPKYSFQRDLFRDIVSGFTVAIISIPHGMGYGVLAGMGPRNGLFMGIYPVLVYFVLGTSKHISIGTFAIISMMTYKVVQLHSMDVDMGGHTAEEIATALAVMTGLIHLILFTFKLGKLSALLNDALVSGFISAATVHVVTSQLKHILGLSMPRFKGYFRVIFILHYIGNHLASTHSKTMEVSAVVIVSMIVLNEFVKPWFAKYTRFPLPVELFVVVTGTLVSRYMGLTENYGVSSIGPIPTGLPSFTIPAVHVMGLVALDAIAISIVSYFIVMSMGLRFARKHSYQIRSNQELFAMACANLVGGCFACFPMACSLSRSVVQEMSGGRSQIASFVSAMILLTTVLWIGPFFSTLPQCVLSAIIIVSLKPLIMQARDLVNYAQQGYFEIFSWISTFVCVIIVDIDIGLLVGIIMSLLTVYFKGTKSHSALLGTVPGVCEGVYVDMALHQAAVPVPETKIFRFHGPLNFATRKSYQKLLHEAINEKWQNDPKVSLMHMGSQSSGSFRVLILDLSCIAYLDFTGCQTISEIQNEMSRLAVKVFIASPLDPVYDALVKSIKLGEGPFEVFATLFDAVAYANAYRNT